jgi:hypothetical protein
MASYPLNIRRCQHIKVNGTQCGSPALREEKLCFFHTQWTRKNREIHPEMHESRWNITLALLEDANSIQMGLGEVMRMLVTRLIDHKTAALMLYALQTASSNLKHTSFEPNPTSVVIDEECVERRPLGATAWSTVQGREYDELPKNDVAKTVVTKNGDEEDESDSEGRRFEADLMYLTNGLARDPAFLDRRVGEAGGNREQLLVEH